MTKEPRQFVSLAVAGLLAAGAALAQEELDPSQICDLDTDSIKSCDVKSREWMAKRFGLVFDEGKQEAEQEVITKLNAKNTGTGSALSGRQSVTDFLARMAFSSDGGGISDSGGESVTFELNDFLGLATDDGYKLTAELRPAEVSKQLIDLIPEGQRVARTEELKEQLGDLDDTRLSLSYSPTNKRWGRAEEPHEDLWDALFESVKAGVEPITAQSAKASAARTALLNVIGVRFAELAETASSDEESKRLWAFFDAAESEGPKELKFSDVRRNSDGRWPPS